MGAPLLLNEVFSGFLGVYQAQLKTKDRIASIILYQSRNTLLNATRRMRIDQLKCDAWPTQLTGELPLREDTKRNEARILDHVQLHSLDVYDSNKFETAIHSI